ncbi:MAG: beta-propeller domain-containing protein [bacterium]
MTKASGGKSGTPFGIYAPRATFGSGRSGPLSGLVDSGGDGADDHSTTNVQVAGVDESDQVKNDGGYIYMVKGKSVRIIKAYPAGELHELPRIDFSGSSFNPAQLYVNGNKLVVIGSDYHDYPQPLDGGTGPVKTITPGRTLFAASSYPSYLPPSSLTRVIIYDITDRAGVREERNLTFEADYLQSRRVDDTLYLIMNQYPQYIVTANSPQGLVPRYADSTRSCGDEPLCDCEQVSYVPGSTESSYLIVVAIPLQDPAKEIGSKVVLGAGQNLYASKDNLYLAEISYIDEQDPARYYLNGPHTLIHKFSFDDVKISYAGKGKVAGFIINQFCMDEYDHHFRIATSGRWNARDEENISSNNLFVLDEDMKLVGSIENIAPGENIKSVRFMGERAYIVTFLQVDPLFVISLKDPSNPQILGQLKIPGYSEYLHPYDENHLIGFGREVDPIEADKLTAGGAIPSTALLGMKLSLFDVSEVTHPTEVFKEVIGYRHTDSELLRDHKALLFSKADNIMAFPVTVTRKIDQSADKYQDFEYIFQGAYFYQLDLTSGFEKKAAITHYDNPDEAFLKIGYRYYGGEDEIRRIISIGDHFYTISDSKIKAIGRQTYDEDMVITLDK